MKTVLRLVGFASALLCAACAQWGGTDGAERAGAPVALKTFSTQLPGPGVPLGWSPLEFGNFKRATSYELVQQDGRTVLQARAQSSASGLIQRVHFDPRQYPLLSWSWKVPALIAGADNTLSQTEDSPARIIIAFDGDTDKLPVFDRVASKQFEMITHRQLPYATLMYIWENHAPKGTVITSAHTGRIKMIVVESGAAKVGAWDQVTRNLYEDYKAAFGEEPKQVKWIGVMTDTDNTGESTRAFYGDIKLERASMERLP